MTIRLTSNQFFLELIYHLQNSHNKEIINLRVIADKLLNQKVYRLYDYHEKKYIYSLSPYMRTVPIKSSGRPHSLTDEQKKEIKQLKNTKLSNENIAKMFNVSETTIRNVLKNN